MLRIGRKTDDLCCLFVSVLFLSNWLMKRNVQVSLHFAGRKILSASLQRSSICLQGLAFTICGEFHGAGSSEPDSTEL